MLATSQRGRESFGNATTTPFLNVLNVPTQARDSTKFNRKQEEKVRNSIK
jgi:hypothetical protein